MADVYLALDRKHDRRVAIKVLKPELSAILGGERFLNEIRVTANLQHPSILPLYDSGAADGLIYYVMPYIEEDSLRDRMKREGQLPLDVTMQIARDIAGALQHAHERGIVHRDIKPENVLLQEGRAVVADFGIALALRQAGGERMTQTGLSLGTPHYMSPEQATGDRDLDARSDVYSLGAVVYEMLVGEPPHQGRSIQAIVAKILSDTPTPIRRARDLIPPNVDAAVQKALAKSPADRFASAQAFAEALANPAFTLPTAALTAAVPTAARPRRGGRLAWPVAAAVAALAAAAGWLRPAPAVEEHVTRYLIELPGRTVPLSYGAISADGTRIAYFGMVENDFGLLIKDADETEGRLVRGGPAGTPFIALSPDGSAVVTGGSALSTVPSGGGPATVLRPGSTGAVAWLDDGTIVAVADTALVRVPATGGTVENLPFERNGTVNGLTPLPGSRGILVFTALGVSGTAWVYDFEEHVSRELMSDAGGVWFIEPDIVVVPRISGSALGMFALRLDLRTLEPIGDPVPLAEPFGIADGFFSDLLLARDGTLVRSGTATQGPDPESYELSWVDRAGTVTPADSTWRFRRPPPNGGMRLSPDGTRVAISVPEATGALNIFVKRLPEGAATKVTFSGRVARRPTWHPSGSSLLYVTGESGKDELWQVRADGVGTPTRVWAEERAVFEGLWSPEADWVVYRTDDEGASGAGDILAALAGGEGPPTPLAASPAEETSPALSPDGRWLAYSSTESGGAKEIFVRPFPNAEDGRWQVSTSGGTEPAWSPDGSELFYWDGADFVAARVATDRGFEVVGRATLFSARFTVLVNDDHRWYDVADDGRFLMVTTQSAATGRTVLVENFDVVVRQALGR